MPEFRIAHVGDGTTVAESITKKFTSHKYNLQVELLDLRRRISSSSSSSSSSSTAAISSTADISVLLVTPAMMIYLNDLMDEERTVLTRLMQSSQGPVALSCFVPASQVKEQITVTFDRTGLTWRHLEVGVSRESFHQCMIELMSMFEEGQGEMPLPMLKKFHLLPDKTVLAGDTVYILLEKQFVDDSVVQSLNVVFEDDSQVTANQISDCLFQLEVPETSRTSITIEVFTIGGQSIGGDVIKYKDKLQVFADVLYDIIYPIEVLCQTLEAHELSEETMDPVIADWFKCDGKTSRGDTRRLLIRWVKALRNDKISPAHVYKELPIFLYLCTKYNLNTFAQTLLKHLKLSSKGTTASQNEQDNTSPDFQNNRLYEFTTDEKEEDQSSSSGAVEDYESPDYCIPDDILVQPRSGRQSFYVDIDYDTLSQRKISTASEIMPEKIHPNLEKERLSKSCPPACNIHGLSQPCYANIPSCQQSDISMVTHLSSNSPGFDFIEENEHTVLGKSTSLPLTASEHSHAMTTSLLTNSENLTSDMESAIEALACVEIKTQFKSVINSKSSERTVVPPLPKQRRKFNLKNDAESHLSNMSQEDVKPQLPPRPNSDSSKPHITQKSTDSRRMSLASSLPPTPPSLSTHPSCLSLSRLNEYKSNIHEHIKSKSSSFHLSNIPQEITYSNRKKKTPAVPYSCRPSPPIPKSLAHREELSYSTRSSNGSNHHPEVDSYRTDTYIELKLQQASGMVVCDNDQDILDENHDISPDYSQPIELYFEDFQSRGFMRSDSSSGQEETIYERLDEVLESLQKTVLTEEDFIYDVPRKGSHRAKTSSAEPTSPELPHLSPSSPSPDTLKKSSSRSSPIWSSLSSKLSLRKPGKTKKQSTKL